LLTGGVARGAADDAEALKRLQDELRGKQDTLNARINDIRKEIERSDDVEAAREAVAAARKACDAAAAVSPTVVEAKRAVTEAQAAARAAAEADAVGNPEVAAADREVADAEEAQFDAESQRRVAEFTLRELERKAERRADVRPLREALDRAQRAWDAARRSGTGVDEAAAARAVAAKALAEAAGVKAAATPEAQAPILALTVLRSQEADVRDRVTKARRRRGRGPPRRAKWSTRRSGRCSR
jgi:hypothetical protein